MKTQGGCSVRKKAEIGVEEYMGLLEAGRGRNTSLQVSEGVWPCQHLDFRLLANRTVRQWISVVISYLVFGALF